MVTLTTPESFGRRFIAKFIGGSVSGGVNLFLQILASRCWGPALYGQLAFIQVHFEQFFAILDLGIGNGFLSYISQKRERYRDSYWILVALIVVGMTASLLYVFSVFKLHFSDTVWPGIDHKVVLSGLLFGAALQFSRVVVSVPDAAGIAKKVELLRILRSLSILLILGIGFSRGNLPIHVMLLVFAAGNAVFAAGAFWLGHRILSPKDRPASTQHFRRTVSEMKILVLPLMIYQVLEAGATLLERWGLQWLGGAEQQGLFGAALILSTAASLLSASLSPLFQREMAMAFMEVDRAKMSDLWLRFSNGTFAMLALVCSFLAANSFDILMLTSGGRYAAGKMVTALMFIYPVQQISNQLAFAVLIATNRSSSYLKIGLSRTVVGLILDYFLLAPSTWKIPGLGLGAIGISIKWLACQCMNTVLSEYLNCRFLGIRYRRFFLRQILVFGFGIVAANVVHLGFSIIAGSSLPRLLIRLSLSAFVYSAGILVFFNLFSSQFSAEKEFLLSVVQRFFGRLPASEIVPPGLTANS